MGPDGMILVVVNSITPIATSVFFKIFKKTQKFYKKSVLQLQKWDMKYFPKPKKKEKLAILWEYSSKKLNNFLANYYYYLHWTFKIFHFVKGLKSFAKSNENRGKKKVNLPPPLYKFH